MSKVKKYLDNRGFVMHLDMFDNEALIIHRDVVEASGSKCKMVPRNVRRINRAERSMHMLKEYFLRVLTVVEKNFTMSIWDHLIPQVVIGLNLSRQINFHPQLSLWALYNGQFDFNASPMGPQECRVLTHEPVLNRGSWVFHTI